MDKNKEREKGRQLEKEICIKGERRKGGKGERI
jgi:hypothetical protein